MGFFSGLFSKQNTSESNQKDEPLTVPANDLIKQNLDQSIKPDVAFHQMPKANTDKQQEKTLQSAKLDQANQDPSSSPELNPNASLATNAEDSSIKMTKEDIIAAYKIFLKRPPESMEVVMPRVGLSADRVLIDFFSSAEFLARPEAVKLIFSLAKKILDEQAAIANPSNHSNPSSPSAAPTAPATPTASSAVGSVATSANANETAKAVNTQLSVPEPSARASDARKV